MRQPNMAIPLSSVELFSVHQLTVLHLQSFLLCFTFTAGKLGARKHCGAYTRLTARYFPQELVETKTGWILWKLGQLGALGWPESCTGTGCFKSGLNCSFYYKEPYVKSEHFLLSSLNSIFRKAKMKDFFSCFPKFTKKNVWKCTIG